MTDPIPVKAPPPSPVAPRQTPDDTFVKHGRLLALISAGTDGTDSERCLDEVRRLGWTPLVNRAMDVLPMVDGFILLNPGGVKHGEQMQLTQMAQAKRAGLDWISRDFVVKWQRVCDSYRNLGREPIAYVGSYKDDLLVHSVQRDGQTALFHEAFDDIANAGFTFALDTFHKLTPDVRTAALSMLTRIRTHSKHTKIYVEPHPCVIDGWANDYKVGAMLTNYNASFKWQSSRLTDNLPDFKGEVIVHISNDMDSDGQKRGWDNPQWILDDLRKCRELGWSAAVPAVGTNLKWEDMRAALNGVTT